MGVAVLGVVGNEVRQTIDAESRHEHRIKM